MKTRARVDLLIRGAAQVATCAGRGGPKRGGALRDVGLIEDGAVAVKDGAIVAVGKTGDLAERYAGEIEIDAVGKTLCPGFVDPHTHAVYAGDRVGEFEKRLAGATYLEIMASGGGIASTTRATRASSQQQLVAESRVRLDAMLRLGTTTTEVKTGYGLELSAELKQLRAIAELDSSHPMDLVPTFLGAHALPPEFTGKPDDYVACLVEEMLPAAAAWHRDSHFHAAGAPIFVDVYCEREAFSVDQARRVLRAGRELGMAVKAHVDQFTELGGLRMALEEGAVSVDHLDVTAAEGIAKLAASSAVGVLIPAASFHLGSSRYARARAMIDAGAAIALTTDINPGSAPCPSLQLVMAIACRYQGLSPAEALNAVTLNAAHAIAMGGRVGSLEVGKRADLLVIGAPDYRHLTYQFGGNLVEGAIKDGKVAAGPMLQGA